MAKRQCCVSSYPAVGTPKWLLTSTVDQAVQSSVSMPAELVGLVVDYMFDHVAIAPQQPVLARDANGFWRRAMLAKLVYGRAMVTLEESIVEKEVDVFTDVRHLGDVDVVVSTWTGKAFVNPEVLLHRLPDVDQRSGVSFGIGRGCLWTHPTTYHMGHLPLLQLVKDDDEKHKRTNRRSSHVQLLLSLDVAKATSQLCGCT